MSSRMGVEPGHLIARFSQRLHEVLDGLADAPVWSMTVAEQASVLVELSRAETRLVELRLRVLAAADRDDVAAESGASSTGAWWAAATRRVGSVARAEVAFAVALGGRFEATRAALAAGVISVGQARVIVAAVQALPEAVVAVDPGLVGLAEQHLIGLAGEHDEKALKVLGRRVFEVLDPEAADAEDGRRLADQETAAARATYLRMFDNGDGTVTGQFKIASIHAAMLRKLLESLISARPHPHTPDSTSTSMDPNADTGADTGAETSPETSPATGTETSDADHDTASDADHDAESENNTAVTADAEDADAEDAAGAGQGQAGWTEQHDPQHEQQTAQPDEQRPSGPPHGEDPPDGDASLADEDPPDGQDLLNGEDQLTNEPEPGPEPGPAPGPAPGPMSGSALGQAPGPAPDPGCEPVQGSVPGRVSRPELARPELMGEAFGQLLERVPADRVPKAGGVSATVVVLIDYDTLLSGIGTAQLDTGEHLSAALARRLACEAGIIPVVYQRVLGGGSVVLDMGRKTRFHTEHQRIAMSIEHGGCTAAGCDRPSGWCQAHHPVPWSRGGETSLRNGRLLCPHHHRRAHDPRYDTTDLPNGQLEYHRRT